MQYITRVKFLTPWLLNLKNLNDIGLVNESLTEFSDDGMPGNGKKTSVWDLNPSPQYVDPYTIYIDLRPLQKLQSLLHPFPISM